MFGMSRKPVVGLDPTLPNPAEEESKTGEQPDSPPAKPREARSAKVAPSPVTGEHYTPTTAPSFLALSVPGAASYTPGTADGGGALCPPGADGLTPVHRLTKLLDDSQGPEAWVAYF